MNIDRDTVRLAKNFEITKEEADIQRKCLQNCRLWLSVLMTEGSLVARNCRLDKSAITSTKLKTEVRREFQLQHSTPLYLDKECYDSVRSGLTLNSMQGSLLRHIAYVDRRTASLVL